MVIRKRAILAALCVLLAASACGQEEAAQEAQAPQRYVADLAPLNGSDVEGTARMSLAGDHLSVDIDARGLEPRIHAQYIHGTRDQDRRARCPQRTDDTDADGFVGLEEARRRTGRELLALEPFPTVNRSRRLDWDLTLNVDPERLMPLDRRVLVLSGRSADLDRRAGAEYLPDVPVACGPIEPARAVASEEDRG